jgi:L-xylulose reductase
MKDTQKLPEVVVITGASKGLGQAMAVEFVRRGATVAGFARSEQGLAETAARIGKGHFVPLVVDVADATAVQRSFQSIEQTVGPVSILINNAAIYEHFDFLDADPDRFMESMRINLGGVVNCCHSGLMGMTQRGVGRILNVTTFADLAPLSGSAAYSVSKGAARIFTRALVADLADRFPGIVISDWIPGGLATGMGVADGLAPDVAARFGVTLALERNPSFNGTLFDRDREVLAPRSLRRKVLERLLFKPAQKPRLLVPAQ